MNREPAALLPSHRSALLIVENCAVPFDRRVWQEARTLREYGYRVCVLAPRDPGQQSRETLEGIEVYRHPRPPEASGTLGYMVEYGVAMFWEFIYSWRIYSGAGFDVIHVSNPPDTLFLVGGVFKLLFGKKLIFDHHDICPELYQAKFGRKRLALRVICQLEKWSIAAADIVISTNESYRRIAIERGRKNPSRVFVVRNGPDLTRVRLLTPVESLKRGRCFLIGYVGVIGVQEGLQYLIQAVAHIVYDCHRSDIHIAVMGSGSELENMRRLAIQLGVDNYFTFTGRVPDRVLLEYLSTADICVNPDEYNEMNDQSTMIKVMEYMALGKPIVQFDLAEARISAAEASLYARPNDPIDFAMKIMELLDDPARRDAMGRFGRMRVERELAWPHQASKLLAAYDVLWSEQTLRPAANSLQSGAI